MTLLSDRKAAGVAVTGLRVSDTGDAERLTALRRMKLVATGLLGVMAVIFVVAWTLQDSYPWLGYVRAAAEAGMVGALADWFAVTALFRRPMGLPIPHTAIIPERKEAIGSSLSQFVAENFLNEGVVREKLARLEVASRAGAWLSQPEHAGRVTQEVAALVRGASNVLDDDDVSEVLASTLQKRMHELQVGPPLGRVLGDVVARGDHHDLVQVLTERIHDWVRRNERLVSGTVLNRAPVWTPRFVDAIVSDKLYREVEKFTRELRDDRHHQLRISVDKFLAEFAHDLQFDEKTRNRVDEIKRRIVDNPEVQSLARSAWRSVKNTVLDAAEDPNSALRVKVTAGLQEFGEKLRTDKDLSGKVDGWLADAAGYASRRYAREVASIIDDTVAAWDGEATSRKIELLVGRDLQFIRINGTVVGALAGLVIYTLAHNLLG